MSRRARSLRHGALAIVLGGVLAGCSDDVETGPIVPSLAVVPRTHLHAEADQAITACNVNWDRIGGIGLVPRARDVPLYAPVSPQTIEIQSDQPAWVIQIRGQFTAVLAPGTMLDPTCVVINGSQTLFGTGGGWDDRGVFTPDRDVWYPPGRLPPLGP
jgi:hypothetical protein